MLGGVGGLDAVGRSLGKSFLGLLTRCINRCVRESHMAPIKCILHPYTVCNAYPCMTMSMASLKIRIIMKIPTMPAVADPNVIKPFHICAAAVCE